MNPSERGYCQGVMRQEPRWPDGESAEEFLARTLSTDQWRAIQLLLEDERVRATSGEDPEPDVC